MSSLSYLKEELCRNAEVHCRVCFDKTPFKRKQNPPNVFRSNGSAKPLVFVFDKPNDNCCNQRSSLIPITIFDDRARDERHSRLRRAPSHRNLITLCQLLGLIPSQSESLESSKVHITNAVKCDISCENGESGRIPIPEGQVKKCRERFFFRELKAVRASVLVFFGRNAQKYILGTTTPLWKASEVMVSGQRYKVLRVPHTSPMSFNTHGELGKAYIKPILKLIQ